ncbi:uroplakin-3b [Narcine bancroftii]|uniref:uroplakin-3b n=1 Tax=Narcine bancroftii TaxID=1343680 RepID=UPI00383194C4
MEPLAHLALLCALCAVGRGVPEKVPYVPELLQASISGKLTQTTVAMEQPLCVFDNIDPACNFCEVWFVVDNITSTSAFDNNNNNVDPSAFMSQNYLTNGFYLTVKTARDQYKCQPTVPPGNQMLTLRIGNEEPCTTINCNAPLPSGSVFRGQYVLLNPILSTDNVLAVTEWSSNIQLLKGIDFNSIDTSTRRSGGMVVITTILSILLFLLLVLFIILLALTCCRRSGKADFPEPLTSFGSLRGYKTHSLQNKGNIISSKPNI